MTLHRFCKALTFVQIHIRLSVALLFDLYKMDVPSWLHHKWRQKLQSGKILSFRLPWAAFYCKCQKRKMKVLCLCHIIAKTWKPMEFIEQWYYALFSSNLDQNRLPEITYKHGGIFHLILSWNLKLVEFNGLQSCCLILRFVILNVSLKASNCRDRINMEISYFYFVLVLQSFSVKYKFEELIKNTQRIIKILWYSFSFFFFF